MCGRYTLASDADSLIEAFGIDELASAPPRYNIAPSQAVAALRQANGNVQLFRPHWGLVPQWSKDRKMSARMINARAETIAEKPAFRSALNRRRCLVLADGYYEWVKAGKSKQPYYITLKSRTPFAFAGIWETWQNEDDEPYLSCSIVTCSANEALARLHHRMPVILDRADYSSWLDEATAAAHYLELLKPAPDALLSARPVSTFVNSPANDGPACVEPLEH